MARIDYDRASAAYDRGRALPAAAFRAWRTVLEQYWPTHPPAPAVDIGSGTGIWLELLADWFESRMIGVEPSEGMRAVAAAKSLAIGTSLVAGDAQALPLRSASCTVVWLSTVIHHVGDLWTCAAEVRRVLQPDGVVLIRSSFPGRHDEIPLFRLFPGAARAASSFPTVDATIDAFAAAGFSFLTLRRVHEVRDMTPAEMAQSLRAMRHADSSLGPLSDEEFAAGMAELEAVTSRDELLTTGLDLLVFGPP